MLRRGFRPSRLGAAVMLRREFRPSRLGAAVMLRCGFRPSRLDAAVIAMISSASGVWTLLFDDLSFSDFLDSLQNPLQSFRHSSVKWDGFRNTLDSS